MLFQQRAVDGSTPRSKKWGKIRARQGSREVLVASALASKEDVFGGISWSAGEIRHEAFVAGQPITIGYSVEADDELTLHGQVYVVEY